MPPTNVSFLLATDMGSSLPIINGQTDINDAGVNYDVYYKFTCPAGLKMVWAWATSGRTSGYMPIMTPYDQTQTEILTESADAPLNNNPIQFPVTPTQIHYLKVRKNVDSAGPESVSLQVRAAPDTSAIPYEAVIVNGDIANQPCGIFSPTTNYQTIKWIQSIAVGESGDISSTGRILLENRISSNKFIALYSGDNMTELGRDSTMLAYSTIRYNRTTGYFWIAAFEDPTFCKVYKLNPAILPLAKTLVATISGPGKVSGFATNITETVAYYYQVLSGFGLALKRWNLSTNLAMSDFVTAPSVDYAVEDVLVLEDDSVVVGWTNKQSATGIVKVRRYDNTGAQLNEYQFDSYELGNYGAARLAYGANSPSSFWVKLRERSAGVATGDAIFKKINPDTGVTISEIRHLEYHERNYIGPAATSYRGETGIWNSCPLVVYNLGTTTPSGIYLIVPNKRNDLGSAIPNPTFKTGLMP